MIIKSFGKEMHCSNIDDLNRRLQSEFRGMSVSVHYTKKSGIKAFVCLDVPKEPSNPILHSYSERVFDLKSLPESIAN